MRSHTFNPQADAVQGRQQPNCVDEHVVIFRVGRALAQTPLSAGVVREHPAHATPKTRHERAEPKHDGEQLLAHDLLVLPRRESLQ
eukprot:5350460-Lingulodinium_polyedra.AAC.1